MPIAEGEAGRTISRRRNRKRRRPGCIHPGMQVLEQMTVDDSQRQMPIPIRRASTPRSIHKGRGNQRDAGSQQHCGNVVITYFSVHHLDLSSILVLAMIAAFILARIWEVIESIGANWETLT